MGVIDERLKELRLLEAAAKLRQDEPLHGDGGGGTSGGMSDDWKASVDQQLGQLHSDVRALLYGLIAGFLVLAGAGAVAFVNLSGQIADARKDIGAVQVEQAKVGGKIDVLLERTAPKK